MQHIRNAVEIAKCGTAPGRRPYHLLEECIRNGLSWTELHGYRWFRPLERAPRTKWNRALLAETYILAGDLNFVIGAPCAFVRSYLRAFCLCPRRRSIIREAAEVVSMMEPCKQSKPCDALLRRMAHKTALPRSILDEFRWPTRLPCPGRYSTSSAGKARLLTFPTTLIGRHASA
jgi:hypothetical protein